jgi:nicotinate-nucleotide adenylyltransferase
VTSQKKRTSCSHGIRNSASLRFFSKPPAAAGAIGIIGGVFDPIHNGHLALAHLSRNYFSLEKMLLVPAGLPAHKSPPIASIDDRLAMTRLALRNDPDLVLWDGEIRRGGTSYSIDTLKALSRKYPGKPLYFIIGADNLREIRTWHRYKEIIAMVTLCVASRPGCSNTIPRNLTKARISFFPSPEWGISSTMLRAYFKQGFSCRNLVPDAVLEYIKRYKLYA